MDYLEADETKNDTPILICRSYQEALIEEITSINIDLVLEDGPDLEEHEAIYQCLILVEDCVNNYIGKIRTHCLNVLDDEEKALFIDELWNAIESSDYSCQMEELRARRFQQKYNEIELNT
jgi:hypothetical protein